MNGFCICLTIGEKTEQEVFSYLESRGHTVNDVTGKREYQKKDIDCLLEREGKVTSLEIKSDARMHNSGNFFFEEGFDRKSGFRKGWFNYCEADYICMYDNVSDSGYIIDFQKAKEVVRKKADRISWFNSVDNCTGYAYLLPIDLAKEEGLIVHEFKLKGGM